MARYLGVAAVLLGVCTFPTVADAQTETVVYFHTDAIGSVRMTTDATGQVMERFDYAPFGEPWPSPARPETRRFAGGELDPETELNYFGARYYQSQTGRFSRSDDPGYGNPFDPPSMNMYAYAYDNPLIYIDPTGHQAAVANDPTFYGGVTVIVNNPGVTPVCGPDTTAGECDSGYLKFLIDAFTRPWENIGRPLIFPETPREIAASLVATTVASVVFSGGTTLPGVAARAGLLTKISSNTLRGSRYASLTAGTTAKEFQRNLIANGYKVVGVRAGSNGGAVTVLSNGSKTYNIYAVATSTGGPTAQVMNAAGQTLSKIRLIGP